MVRGRPGTVNLLKTRRRLSKRLSNRRWAGARESTEHCVMKERRMTLRAYRKCSQLVNPSRNARSWWNSVQCSGRSARRLQARTRVVQMPSMFVLSQALCNNQSHQVGIIQQSTRLFNRAKSYRWAYCIKKTATLRIWRKNSRVEMMEISSLNIQESTIVHTLLYQGKIIEN